MHRCIEKLLLGEIKHHALIAWKRPHRMRPFGSTRYRQPGRRDQHQGHSDNLHLFLRLVLHIRTDWPAALPIFADTLARHCPTVSPGLIPFAASVEADRPVNTEAIVSLSSAFAMFAPFAGPKL